MKAALIVLGVCAVLLFAWLLYNPTAQIRVENLTEIDKASNIEISIDRKVIFKGIVEDVPKKLRMRLSKGNHYLLARQDNGEYAHGMQFTVKGKTRIDVKYQARYPLDPVTNKPKTDVGLSRSIWLTVSDWDYPSKEVYAEIPRGKKQ